MLEESPIEKQGLSVYTLTDLTSCQVAEQARFPLPPFREMSQDIGDILFIAFTALKFLKNIGEKNTL